jgi:hypothetical protein
MLLEQSATYHNPFCSFLTSSDEGMNYRIHFYFPFIITRKQTDLQQVRTSAQGPEELPNICMVEHICIALG